MSPQITSPQATIRYIVKTDSQENNSIPFSAVTDAGIAYVYWFVNDVFVARIKTGDSFLWKAQPGKYIVRVVDDHGLSDVRDIEVQLGR